MCLLFFYCFVNESVNGSFIGLGIFIECLVCEKMGYIICRFVCRFLDGERDMWRFLLIYKFDLDEVVLYFKFDFIMRWDFCGFVRSVYILLLGEM